MSYGDPNQPGGGGFGAPPAANPPPQQMAQGSALAQQPFAGGGGGELTKEEKLWATLAHASFFVLSIFGPLILMYAHESIVGKKSAFVAQAAKQALIYQIGALVITMITCGFGFFIAMIFPILGALATNKGEWYVYPGLGSFVDKQLPG
ncbi:MAG: DUF4870 domain-containing protein [Myxococcota bacterium]